MIRDLLKWVAPGAVTILGGTVAALAMATPDMLADLQGQGDTRLVNSGFAWAHIDLDGRDVLLTGTIDSDTRRNEAITLLASIRGVGAVIDHVAIAPRMTPYQIDVTIEDGALILSGGVPSSRLLNVLTAQDGLDVANLSVRSGHPDENSWMAGLQFALARAELVDEGVFRLSDLVLTVEGRAKTERALGAMQIALADLPDGVSLGQVNVAPVLVRPYTWTAEFDGARIAVSGHVPEDATVEMIRTADVSGLPIATGLSLASGAPDGFGDLTRTLIEQLARLDHGSASIVDGVSTLSGAPPNIEVAQAVTEALPNSIVTLSPPPVSDYWVSVTRQEGGVLVFDGYAPNQAARDAFGEIENADVNYLKLGSGASAYYQSGVDFGLRVLDQMSEGRLVLNGNVLTLSGTANDESAYRSIQALLDREVPQGVSLAATQIEAVAAELPQAETPPPDNAEINPAEPPAITAEESAEPQADAGEDAIEAPAPVEQVPVDVENSAPAQPSQIALCQARVAELSAHNAILFQSGNAVIADSAEAELDRFGEALNLCPDTKVYVEGHTDSDGDDQRNLALSVARAEAVVNALIERGVDASRLYAVGYGESQPVADNATQEGKRQNRRIVVTVEDGDNTQALR